MIALKLRVDLFELRNFDFAENTARYSGFLDGSYHILPHNYHDFPAPKTKNPSVSNFY